MTRAAPMRIVWFRQDLRLHDQPALAAALAGGAAVLPVYVLDTTDHGGWRMGAASRWWLHHSLESLASSLRALGAPLVLRAGDPVRVLPALAEDAGAGEIHAGIAHEPAWRRADAAIAKALEGQGRRLVLHRTSTLIDPDAIRSQTGTVYGMYTPFARAVDARGEPPPPLPAPRLIHAAPAPPGEALASWKLRPGNPDWASGWERIWRPGEANARALASDFAAGAMASYATGRNLPGIAGTSRLSPHLHFGEISPRAAWHASRVAGDDDNHHVFRRELIWREFAAYLLWHHPALPRVPLRPAFAKLGFRDDPRGLRAWQQGRTGVPIVDAGMRQLWQTGWMHNRVRMIVASFLVKHLLVAWQLGEAWFWDTLVDADLASNAAGWQWVAGTGIDAQPFFRVFNPVTQGETFDADGAYVRRYVPELAGLPNRYIHRPWQAPELELRACGVVLGRSYPRPIVDLAEGRARALEVYRATVKDQSAKDHDVKDRDVKDRDAKDRDAKDRDAKDRDAKDRDAKDRTAKDRTAKDRAA